VGGGSCPRRRGTAGSREFAERFARVVGEGNSASLLLERCVGKGGSLDASTYYGTRMGLVARLPCRGQPVKAERDQIVYTVSTNHKRSRGKEKREGQDQLLVQARREMKTEALSLKNTKEIKIGSKGGKKD